MLRRQLKQSPGPSKSPKKRPLPPAELPESPPPSDDKAEDDIDAREAALEEDVLGVAGDIVDALSKKREQKPRKKRRKKPDEEEKKWVDSDDEQAKDFETVTPSWADKFDDDNSDDSDEEALKAHSYGSLAVSASLPSAALEFKRVTDGNKEEPSTASLRTVEFHPKATVMLTGGPDNTVRLFAVDGSKNRKIHSMFMERTPVFCCHFSKGGGEIIIGSNHKSFYVYDLEGSAGVTFRPRVKGLEAASMSKFTVSPDGRFLAFLGSFGYIHLFSQTSKELIDSLRMNEAVKSVCFSNDGRYMYSFGLEGDVYVWDLNTRDCVHRFHDEGCVHGTSLAVAPDDSYIVCGSQSGIVSVYSREAALASRHPKPIKLIKNLTTTCDQALFNSTSEILALRSKSVQKAVKLVHVPTMTVLGNFPEQFDHDLKLCKAMDFSPSSGYLALGTHQGKALLYRLQHYNKY